MPPSSKSKNGNSDKDKIPIASLQQLAEEVKAFKAALLVKETEHTWEAIDRAVKRFTAVTRGGGYRYETEYVAALRDRDLARAIVGALSTERTQLSAATLLFLSAATRLGPSFAPLLFLYLSHIIRLLSRTNKLYISRATACLTVIIGNTRLAGVIPYLREGMLEKSPTHRKGCMAGLLYAMGGPDPLSPLNSTSHSYEGMLVDRDTVRKKYLDDVETCIRTGARDKDIEVRKVAKKCWEIYRAEFSERVASFAGPLTPIARKYLELPPLGQPVPDYSHDLPISQSGTVEPTEQPSRRPPAPTAVRRNPLPPPPRAPSPAKQSHSQDPVFHTMHRVPARAPLTASTSSKTTHAEANPDTHSSSSMNAAHSASARPPPTLFARRVLPTSSSAMAPSHSSSEQRQMQPSRNLTTFADREPLASTSQAVPTLPKSHTLETIHVHSKDLSSWMAHQRAATAPSAASLPESRPSYHREVSAGGNRPPSSCSQASSAASSSTSPYKEPFKPSSSTSSRSAEQTDLPIHPAPQLETASETASLKSARPHQRRVVPTQVNRAPSRATRRASRVLPPSTDLQAFLSSAVTDAASEFKWPESGFSSHSTALHARVELPIKRPASAMSTGSHFSSTAAAWQPNNAPAEATSLQSEIPPRSDVENRCSQLDVVPVASFLGDMEARGNLTNGQPEETAPEEEDLTVKIPIGSTPQSTLEGTTTAMARYTETIEARQSEAPHNPAENPALQHPVEKEGVAALSKKQDELPLWASAPASTERTLLPQVADVLTTAADARHPTGETQITSEVPESLLETLATGQHTTNEEAMPPVNVATLAASVPAAASTVPLRSDASRPALSGMRSRTAFRPQKHHKLADEVNVLSPPKLDDTQKVPQVQQQHSSHPAGVPAGFGRIGPRPDTTDPQTEAVPAARNPLGHSVGASKSQIQAGPAPQIQGRSVSTYAAGTLSTSNGNPSIEKRLTHSMHSSASTLQTGIGMRGMVAGDRTRQPPSKKQALSSSTGPTSMRPAFGGGGGGGRAAAGPTKAAVGHGSSRLPATKPTARQGSIFSRLAAPTAASAGKVKPRLPSESRDTFKKPAIPTGTLSKKVSGASLKSSQGPSGAGSRNLKDATNTAGRGRVPSGTSGKTAAQGANTEKPQGTIEPVPGERMPALIATDLLQEHVVHQDLDADPDSKNISEEETDAPARSGLEDPQQSVPVAEQASSQPSSKTKQDDLPSSTKIADVERVTDESLHAAISVPLPQSPDTVNDAFPNTPHVASHSILAELGIDFQTMSLGRSGLQSISTPSTVDAAPVSEALPAESPSKNVSPIWRSVGESTDLRLQQDQQQHIQQHSLNTELPKPASVPLPGSTVEQSSPMQQNVDEDSIEDGLAADQTVIVHALEDGHMESGTLACSEALRAADCSLVASPTPDDGNNTAAESTTAETVHGDLPDSHETEADTPNKEEAPQALSRPHVSSNLLSKPDGASPAQDASQTLDTSVSMLASPTRCMQDLLARSTGSKAVDEGSPLLLEKEFLPSNGVDQYMYDDTILDAYGSADAKSVESKHHSAKDVESTSADQAIADPEDEEEDEIALLISRELSTDSLEELASRWEESRVIGSLGLLDASNEDFDLENTPMRPKFLTRFSDGESSDYGPAPIGTAAYTKDDEDAALDTLLSMGHHGDTMGWNGKDAILTDSLLMMPGRDAPASTKAAGQDRGILAEMSAYADTPKVTKRHVTADHPASEGRTHIKGPTHPPKSILNEGGL